MKLTQSKTDPAPPIPPPIVFMRFRPLPAYIDGIREFGRFFCRATFGTAELAERAGLVLQETLKNAIKYSADDPKSELELEITAEGDSIEFAVSSVPDSARMGALRAELEQLRREHDPHAAYLAALSQAATASGAAEAADLSLADCAGGMALSVEEHGGRIRVTAVGKL